MHYETTIPRVIVSIVAGAGLGATIICGEYLWGLYENLGASHFMQYGLSKGLGVFGVAFVIWGVGISLFGGPLWFWLHRIGLRQLWIAVVAGGIAPFCVLFVWSTRMLTGRTSGKFSYFASGGQQWDSGVLTPFGWQIALQDALIFGLYGCFIGVLVWRVAYRKT